MAARPTKATTGTPGPVPDVVPDVVPEVVPAAVDEPVVAQTRTIDRALTVDEAQAAYALIRGLGYSPADFVELHLVADRAVRSGMRFTAEQVVRDADGRALRATPPAEPVGVEVVA